MKMSFVDWPRFLWPAPCHWRWRQCRQRRQQRRPERYCCPCAAPAASSSAQNENMHLEGEKRFRSNCARCHAAPPKFPPRMMATIVRHMRVRAAITDQDMRLILRYMTE